jgi:quinol monooxygenase YgiN
MFRSRPQRFHDHWRYVPRYHGFVNVLKQWRNQHGSIRSGTTDRERRRRWPPALVVVQWGAKEGQADNVSDILSRFLPEAQRVPGAQLFLISSGKENPGQFLFYELFQDEAAFSVHQETSHFKTYVQGQALPRLAKRERAQYALQ